MIAGLDPARERWMTAPETQAVMRALHADGGEARFVGGAVRNALLGEGVSDVDIATTLLPEAVIARLKAAGLGAVPTGIAHGTVTAIAGGKPFEVTTLRRDVETDGRRAVIAFTTDWREDAMRRDFTMNALYASEDGTLYDYFGGVDDVRAGRVRFVGDAAMRIREDYLRILRLFRFHAWYGKGALDSAALAAATAERVGLKRLSGERVQKELLRLLEAEDPVPVLRVMHTTGILSELLPQELHLNRLERLAAIQRAAKFAPDAALRLAALIPDGAVLARDIAERLKVSNALRERLVGAAEKDSRIAASLDESTAKRLLYRLSTECFQDQVLLAWAASGAAPTDAAWRALFALSKNWQSPSFPLDGKDVMAAGYEEGPRIGVVLRDVETWWVENNFAPDRSALLARLKDLARKARH
jgi:poly(A) polymerase